MLFKIRAQILIVVVMSLLNACSSDSSDSATEPPANTDNKESPADQGSRDEDETTVGPGLSDPISGDFSKGAMLTNIGHVTQRATQDFVQRFAKLEDAVAQYCTSLTPEKLQMARQEWKNTLEKWHFIDAIPYGPLRENASTLRTRIYSWPTNLNLCRIDIAVIQAENNPNFKIASEYTRKGLDALEYLLFDDRLQHHCPPNAPLVQNWNERSPEDKREARCDYIKAVTEDLGQAVDQLGQRWALTNEGYLDLLSNSTLVDANIQEVFYGMIQFEKVLKDRKLAEPLGQSKMCRNFPSSCPDRNEHPYSSFADEAIYQNVLGFRSIYSGTDPGKAEQQKELGFDDYLQAVGHEELANKMSQTLDRVVDMMDQARDQAKTRFSELKENLSCTRGSQSEENEHWCTIYQDIRTISTDLKTEFAEVLKLQLPKDAQGDTD